MTTDEFIKKAIDRYGDLYTYEKTIYKNMHTPVIVTHKDGYDKQVNPQYFLYKSQNKKNSLTTEYFIHKSKEIFGPDIFDYTKTKCGSYKDKVTITCKKHGDFMKIPTAHLHGKQGCPKCSRIYCDTAKFIEKAKCKHDNKYDYSKVEYVNNHTKVTIICPVHGEFEQTPNTHLSGRGCPKCSMEKRLDTVDDFIKKSGINDRGIELIGEYTKSTEKTRFRCKTCGNEWETYPYKLTIQRGCPLCGHRGSGDMYAYTTDDFIKKARLKHGNKYDYSKVDYKRNDIPVTIICPIHGEFEQKPIKHMTTNGCPKCNETALEIDVRVYCEKNSIKYIYQARSDVLPWLGLLTLDYYFPEYNVAIECQGRQHFMPINHFGGKDRFESGQTRDKLKYQKCIENNVKIYYYTTPELKNSEFFEHLYDNLDDILIKYIK